MSVSVAMYMLAGNRESRAVQHAVWDHTRMHTCVQEEETQTQTISSSG